MARDDDFSDTVKNEVFARGIAVPIAFENLIDMEDNAHHVVADQTGSISDPQDDSPTIASIFV